VTEQNNQHQPIFYEEQKFGSACIVTVVIAIALTVGLSGFSLRQIIYEQKLTNILPIIILIASGVVVPLAVATVFLTLKLQTQVRPDGLYVRFFPFHIRYKKFALDQIAEAYARRYRPLLEYGGWGIKCGFKTGKAYNVKGNWGLQIVFKNGRKLLVGSQKADKLAEAIESISQNPTSQQQNETATDSM